MVVNADLQELDSTENQKVHSLLEVEQVTISCNTAQSRTSYININIIQLSKQCTVFPIMLHCPFPLISKKSMIPNLWQLFRGHTGVKLIGLILQLEESAA